MGRGRCNKDAAGTSMRSSGQIHLRLRETGCLRHARLEGACVGWAQLSWLTQWAVSTLAIAAVAASLRLTSMQAPMST